jgi:formamidopyrimidine-DNA glycosylase
MPELPEVETIVRALSPSLPNRRIVRARIFRPDVLRESPRRFRRGVTGATIRSVSRRGKNIVILLSGPPAPSSSSRLPEVPAASFGPPDAPAATSGTPVAPALGSGTPVIPSPVPHPPTSLVLVVNLGMTGRLLLHRSRDRNDSPSHIAVHLSLESGESLLYADTRRFGRLALYSEEEWEEESKRLGPEPLGKGLNGEAFHRLLAGSKAPLRSWLLNQERLAGVGNIYACEALHRAGIHPLRTGGSLDPRESDRLLRALRKVLRQAIEAQGTTLRDYRTASGQEGGFLPFLRAYGREGQPCLKCRSAIVRMVFSNRSAFLCPACQPEGSPGQRNG